MSVPSGIYPNDDFSVTPFAESDLDLSGASIVFSESSPVSGGGGSHGSTVVPDATYSKIILYCERIDFNAPQNLIAEVTVAPDQTVGVPEGKKIVLNNVTTSGYSQLLPPGLILHTIVIP